MSDVSTFRFSGRDSIAQFIVGVFSIYPAPLLPEAAWKAGGVAGVTIFFVVVVVIVIGLRASIVVRPSRVVIVRKWFFIPYWRHSGRAIENVIFGGDWGDPEGAMGVVVTLDGKELHIGSGKTMHYLHSALPRVGR